MYHLYRITPSCIEHLDESSSATSAVELIRSRYLGAAPHGERYCIINGDIGSVVATYVVYGEKKLVNV